ncbi:MAG: hypothetical protein HQK87_02890 [Nitrospinae bacterium]|nr:hypothetical protein [Nitrospinota bacterium]
MAKLIFSFFLAVLLLIFATQNLHPTWIRFIVGPAVQLPVVVVVGGAFLAGFAVSALNQLFNAVSRKEKDKDKEE